MIIADRDNQDPLPGHEGVRNQGVMEFDIEAWEVSSWLSFISSRFEM